ncbi:MAG TPA: tRNA epoxyqueuosine(34) reductase QueG [Gemmatimonadales bacterium]
MSSVEVKRRAAALGFDATGIAPLEPNPHAVELDQWLAAGYSGTMTYLQRQQEKRADPRRIMPEARVAVVTLTNYFHGWVHPAAMPRGNEGAARVAQYAWTADYHDILGRRLEQLAQAIRDVVPGARTRCYVDAGPVPERELAVRAGLGWIGKNTMLIDPRSGSFTFIGIVLTDADLAPDLPFDADRCGTCRACLDACPTDAFPAPHVLDARRCISYLTIEHRADFTPVERGMVGEWLFGCDVCQDVCPWNVRFAQPSADPAWQPRADVATPDLEALLDADDAAFARRWGDTPFERPGPVGMRRNARAVRGNQAP